MRRRRFIALLGSSTAWALSARAQQPTLPVIGFLDSVVADATAHFMLAFQEGLRETGHIERQNVSIDYRSARGHYDQLPAVVQGFLNRRVAVIAASAPPAAIAAKAATSTVPIVFVIGYDPVEYGLVASLDRPGGNVTGATSSFDVALLATNLKSTAETFGTGARIATPSSLPLSSGSTRPTTFAAPPR